MPEVCHLESDRLSTFRTKHEFMHYGEFRTVDEFDEYRQWAKANGIPIFIVGNGSNTLFVRRKIRTLVLCNRLESRTEDLGDGRIWASSSASVMKIMKWCDKNSLESFYFLASVPATVGGALAMNAGLGAGPTIYEFVESVTFRNGANEFTLSANKIERGHRQTMFTGVHDKLITGAVFQFRKVVREGSEIQKRIQWCHAHQDLSAPNCGSVFRECDRRIIKRVRGLPLGGIRYLGFRTQFSRKVNNWIICRSSRSWPVVLLIRAVQLAHRISGSKAIPELIEVR